MSASAKREIRSLFDVIDQGTWERALFTTFTLSLAFFESHVLPRLYRRGCESITILVDERFYAGAVNSGVAQHVGSGYRVLPVAMRQGGVFHGKLCYLRAAGGVSGSEDVLTVGSGNLTYEGWGGQFECLDVLRPRLEGPAFRDVSAIFERLASGHCWLTGDTAKELQRFAQYAKDASAFSGLALRDGQSILLATLDGDIGTQVLSILRSGAGFSDSGVSEVSATMGHSARRSREHETTPPQPLSGLQGQGGAGSAQG